MGGGEKENKDEEERVEERWYREKMQQIRHNEFVLTGILATVELDITALKANGCERLIIE